MPARASLVFVGVIQKQQFGSWPLFRLQAPGIDPATAENWKILRRQVRVEMVIRGVEPRKIIDVYEIFWTGGASGDWNSTQNGERALFLVRVENGYYHVARDWWRSIFPVTSGPHSSLPLDASHSLWERIALMNYRIERNDGMARISYPYFHYADPGRSLTLWRQVKMLRGLLRHPTADVRVPACRSLLYLTGQDECWDLLSESERAKMPDTGCVVCSADDIAKARRQFQQHEPAWWWKLYPDRDERRLLTAVSDRRMRAAFCRLYSREYPGDPDNACPADRPPPATIVTGQGDVPLDGAWPR